MKTENKLFIASAACLAAVMTETPAYCQSQSAKPNIIFILADDLGYGDVGCYGQKEIKTPNIDRMASEGMRFTSHYSGSTVSAPSRCSLMTGLHTGHCLIRDNAAIALRPEDFTIPELLKEANYTTALIGKWGLGDPGTTGTPIKQGFDYFYGYMNQGHAHNYYPSFLWRNEEKVMLSNVVSEEKESGAGIATVQKEYTHDLFTAEALQYVDKQKDQTKPFFLYLAYTIPHANNEMWRKSGDGMEVPDFSEYAGKDWPVVQKKHAAMITRMDGDIGKLLVKLKSLGLDKNTIVIFTSDNGPHEEGGVNHEFNNSNGIYRGYKRDLYEGGIRVPFIAWWPGKIKAGSQSDHISAFWDIMPTFAEMAGIKLKVPTDGISILPALTGTGTQKTHEYLYWEFASLGGKQAIRSGNWKAVRLNVNKDKEAPIELYDINEDPSEKMNIADDNAEAPERMIELMNDAHVDSKEFPL